MAKKIVNLKINKRKEMEVEICNKNEIKKVLFLQKEFFKENCCNGICLDTIEDLEKNNIYC